MADQWNGDGALKFLALENALINNDGYWARTNDYNRYLDTKGRFHLIPHDANETFSKPGDLAVPMAQDRANFDWLNLAAKMTDPMVRRMAVPRRGRPANPADRADREWTV